MINRLISCVVGLLVVFAGVRAGAQAGAQQDSRQIFAGGFHQSLSGQFVVHDPPVTDRYPYYPAAQTNLVRLDPALFMVSCERIKHALLTELGARDQWRGKIYLNLHHSQNPDETIVVNPTLVGNQWIYRVSLPDFIDRYRVVSAVAQTVMLEMANRSATNSAEIPAWLAEGMTRQIMRSSQLDLVLEPPHNSENGVTLHREDRSTERASLLRDGAWGLPAKMDQTGNADPIVQTLETLRQIPPLNLDELSWPKDGQFEGQAGEAYRCSAQLFVHELLQLRDGRASMQALLPELSRHLNWQISFLAAFHADFANQLELSKWWALRLVQLTGRDLVQAWSVEESWNRLDDVLNPSVQIRSSAKDLPARGRISLQAAIQDLDLPRQQVLLPETLRQLGELRNRVAPSLVNLVDGYRRVLGGYLYQRDHGVSFPLGKASLGSQLDGVARDAVRQLAVLDQERNHSAPKRTSPQPVVVNVPGNH